MHYRHVKRLMDILGACVGLLLLAVPLAIVSILIKINMGGDAIFRQIRAGKGRQDFVIFKFRTMSHEINEKGEVLPDSERITPLGNFLRKTSIDELPQLFNVLKGDMSLVGPRPLLASYIPFYTEHELTRFDVLPGITGLAQIEGRHNASWDVRLANDITYVENMSFMLDMKIILRTVCCVLRQKDVVAAPSADTAHLHIARASAVFSFGGNGQDLSESYGESRKMSA